MVRCYYVNYGKDITSRLLEDGAIITAWISYYRQKPSYEYIEALEDTVFVYVDYEDTQKIYNDFSEFNKIGRLIVEHAFYLSEQSLITTGILYDRAFPLSRLDLFSP